MAQPQDGEGDDAGATTTLRGLLGLGGAATAAGVRPRLGTPEHAVWMRERIATAAASPYPRFQDDAFQTILHWLHSRMADTRAGK